jgi:two-component system CheB/CheR fusion protein
MTEKNDDIGSLQQMLFKMTGIDFSHYKDDFFQRCVAKRMAVLAVSSTADYLRMLGAQEQEMNRFLESFSVYHSQFMRDPAKYRVLRELVLPDVMRRREAPGLSRTLSIWSAGCAGGEEPYSIAMTAREVMEPAGGRWNVRVHATDINTELLAKARKGVYRADELQKKDLDGYYLDKYFDRAGEDFSVKSTVRSMISFGRANIISDKPLPHMDIIFCRNVLIYFDAAAVRKIILGFHGALNEGGYLFLGNSEIIEDYFFCHFKKVREHGEFVYRKIAAGSDEFREMEMKYRNIKAGLGLKQ